MVLSDRDISQNCIGDNAMIQPFVPNQVSHEGNRKVISYGLSSYGYDIRLGEKVRIARDPARVVGGDLLDAPNWRIDPKTDLARQFADAPVVDGEHGRFVQIPPHGFALAHSLERFNIPRTVLAVCFGKSTYARCGLIVNVTPLEPQWSGYLTLEISNTTPQPALVYVGEGICQLVFHTALRTCSISYADRRGKYHNQPECPVLPKA